MSKYYRPEEATPQPRSWIKCIINGQEGNGTVYGATDWVYCVEVKDNVITLSDTEECEDVYVWNESEYTHWSSNKK